MLAERFAIRPRVDVWLALVLTGLTVALVKHTYALCWIAVLFARVIPFIAPKRLEISPIPVVLLLVAGAVASGIASWLVYAWALGGWAPQIDVLWRPYIQIISIPAAYADDPSIEYPWWFYLRNYPVGYGILNALLILPAIYVAIRSASRLRQSIGIAWLFVLGAMHLLPFYETRYLAFLMPLSAFLLAPLLRFLWLRRRRWTPVLLVLLAVDLLNASVEAVRIFDPFYSENQFGRFFSPIENRKGPVIITNPISFTPDIYSPLVADRYHRIFNMAPQAIVRLYRLGEDQVRLLTPRKYSVPFPLADPATLGEGTLVFSANTVLIRPADAIPSRPRAFTGEFFQVSASVQRRQYERRGSIFESANVASGPFLLFQVDEETGSGQLFSIGSSLSEQEAGQIKKSRVGDGRFGVWGYDAITVCSIGARGSEICKRY